MRKRKKKSKFNKVTFDEMMKHKKTLEDFGGEGDKDDVETKE